MNLNHEALVKEGNRLSEVLVTITAMVKDPETIPEQLVIIKANGERQLEKLNRCHDALDWDCLCNHTKGHHQSGRGKCHANNCNCVQWEVEL